MKIEFDNEKEKEVLAHILLDWFTHNGDYDVLGCEPACRDPKSPGCEYCIKDLINYQLNKNKINFCWCGGEDWILQHGIEKWVKENGINN